MSQDSEAVDAGESATWKARIAQLESIVCDLLVKNEQLRRSLQAVSLDDAPAAETYRFQQTFLMKL